MDKDAYSILEFCQRHGISRSALYNSIRGDAGPRLMKVGARTLISKEAAAEWRRNCEQATASLRELSLRPTGNPSKPPRETDEMLRGARHGL
jgi:predicted DNA-binding transcriptional regulator AlpA